MEDSGASILAKAEYWVPIVIAMALFVTGFIASEAISLVRERAKARREPIDRGRQQALEFEIDVVRDW